MLKKCLYCKKSKDTDSFYSDSSRKDGLSNKCKECEIKRLRIKRRNNPHTYSEQVKRYKLKHPEKAFAHNLVRQAKIRGEILKEPCVICGNKKAVCHHKDYENPLYVIWLCAIHHRQVHDGKILFS